MKKISTIVLSFLMIGFGLVAMPTHAQAESNSYYGEPYSNYDDERYSNYHDDRNRYYHDDPNGDYKDHDGFLDIKNAKIGIVDKRGMADDFIKKVFIETRGEIPEDGSAGAFGYGVVLADGKVIATTTHGGLLDSEDQDDIYDPIWHNHYVQLIENSLCKSTLAIDYLTFESPGEVDIVKNKAILTNLPPSADTLIPENEDNPDEITPGTDWQAVASFKLVPLINLVDLSQIVTVCVEDVQPTDNVEEFEIDGFQGDHPFFGRDSIF